MVRLKIQTFLSSSHIAQMSPSYIFSLISLCFLLLMGVREVGSFCPVFSTGPAEKRDCGTAHDLGWSRKSAKRPHKRRYKFRLILRKNWSSSPASLNLEPGISRMSLFPMYIEENSRNLIPKRTQGPSEELTKTASLSLIHVVFKQSCNQDLMAAVPFS